MADRAEAERKEAVDLYGEQSAWATEVKVGGRHKPVSWTGG